ncbi:MAG: LytTR family DNA-binding domain-containing protein [Lachnospiraceae bacterium]|nr:LytTR family DNA-binding domain-containing protein [Lachnospiraceae bacterium]
MLRIAICDDDRRFTGELEEMVRQEATETGAAVDTEAYSDSGTLVADIEKGYRYDLIFLDIEMERVDGINAARQIRRMDRSALLTYVSGYEQYLKELFDGEPFRFLSKPVDGAKFRKYFRDACARIGETEDYYRFSFNKKIGKVTVRDIVYFESRNRVVHIIMADGSVERFYGRLNDVEKELSEGRQEFLQIHQSYLVNYSYIGRRSFSEVVVVMGDGQEKPLKISKDREKAVRVRLCGMAGRKAMEE